MSIAECPNCKTEQYVNKERDASNPKALRLSASCQHCGHEHSQTIVER